MSRSACSRKSTRAYDAEGNLLTKTELATGTTTEYTWDQRNRLTRVLVKSASGQTIRESNYTYDPFDRRIGVRVDPDGAGPQAAQQTWTVYDGANPYADFNGSGALSDRYLYGAAVDQILADLEADGDLKRHLAENLNRVRTLRLAIRLGYRYRGNPRLTSELSSDESTLGTRVG